MSKIESIRSHQTDFKGDTAISTLRMIEINPIEICNRVCEFCPRSMPELYPNQNLKTSNELIQKIADDCNDFGFDGRIGFVGFGEPTLHKKIIEQIEILASKKTLSFLEINTNGDFLNRNKIKSLQQAGLTHLTVSMYDKDISDDLFEMAKGIDIEMVPRHCYPQKFELKIVNRNDIFTGKGKTVSRSCYIPFYKMFIDWNGDVLTCSEDWGRESNLGNINESTIKDIWLGSNIKYYRNHLYKGKRNKCSPCKGCDINGTLWGKEQADYLQKVNP